jgi:hypothetical protein
MRPFRSLSIIANNIIKQDVKLQQEQREAAEKKHQEDIEYEKRAQKLKEQDRKMLKEKITFLEKERNDLLKHIEDYTNSVTISFIGEEEVVADEYIYLKDTIQTVTQSRDNTRVNSLTKVQILLAELAATAFFIFILIRLASENDDLLYSFVFLSIFQGIFGESMMTLYADLVLQDYPLVLAISYIIAISFKDYDSFYSTKIRKKLFYALGFFIIGLFVSSMLFSY